MDSTVISDAVNLCSRIESLTKEYGLDVAMSDEAYKKLGDSIEKAGPLYRKNQSQRKRKPCQNL